ncbi:cyclophilin-like fold protein, partial [Methanothrix sp.]|uniref:cyclophilin-like fold protein n=1 Tax=Methanothrix sp. TaxID=90426 RepID=UPI003C7114F5
SPSSQAGDICYWSPGPALCIFFGQTQPYSRVNHIGKVVEGLELFEGVKPDDIIILRRRELQAKGGMHI